MAWYGRSSRLIFHLLRRYNSKIPPPPLPSIPTSYSIPRIHHPTFSFYFDALKNSNSNSNSNSITAVASIWRSHLSHFSSQRFFSLRTAPIQEHGSRISHFSHSIFRDLFFKNSKMALVKESASQFPHPIFKNLVLHDPREYYVPLNTSRNLVSQNALKNKSYFNGGAKRVYRWLKRIGLLGCGVAAASVYFWNLETIPYAKRTHFVLMHTSFEKEIGQSIVESKAKKYEWKILPSHHHHSVRAQRIGQEIVGALLKEEQSMKTKMGTAADLEEFEWEFIVVDDPDDVNARCLFGGKIVLSTGLFDYFKTDTEIAAIIGHEVGHAAARHVVEQLSEITLWLKILMPDYVVKNMTDRFVFLPNRRRKELEADYIGMLLMASAGYNPRVAIEVCEKYYRLNPLDEEEEYLYAHPSEKKRAQLLSQPKVMEEALSLYREALKEKAEVEKKEAVGEGEGEGDHPMTSFDRIIYGCVCKVLDLFFKQR